MRTLKLTLEYDGTRYSGWQAQAHARTVQGELQRAAEEFFGRAVEIGGAGRTDAGVHALAQVAHVKFPRWGASPSGVRERITKLRPQEIIYGLNDRLPPDINVLATTDAPPHFHARHDAKARSYLYQISTRRTAFDKKYVWWVKDRLDARAMADAAGLFVGRHDFAAFSERDPKRIEQSSIVVVMTAELAVDGHLLLFHITASHFLWKMVRRLVGSLVEVGRGSAPPADLAQLLRAPQSKVSLDPARATAPPSGLFLASVEYADMPR
jgi:tRNA pseudouridine38-40 synthase